MGNKITCGGERFESRSYDARFTYIRSCNDSSILNKQSLLNICKEFGIGQYMDQAEVQKVDRMWKEIYGISKFLKERQQEEQQIDFKHVYPFVANESDETITQIWFMDKKGFSYIVSLGPLPELRWSCWKLLTLNKRVFQLSYEDKLCGINDSAHQISLDVQRTLVTHPFFHKNNLGQKQLLRVLNAISMTFPKLGYCQGMNFLVGFLLMVSGCDERTCYESFVELLVSPKYLFYFYFCPGLPYLHLCSFIIHEILREKQPEIQRHLETNSIPDSFWITKMIMSIFLYVLPEKACIRIWDYVIAYGSVGIMEIILSIVYLLKDEILKSDMETIGIMFQGQLNNKVEIDVEKTIYVARKQFKIGRSTVSKYTKLFLSQPRSDFELPFWSMFLNFQNKQNFDREINEYIKSTQEVKVSYNELESPISNVQWCGASVVFTKDDETIEQTHQETRKVLFILTDKGRVWRSNDYGTTWSDESKTFEQMDQEGKQLSFESIQISPADSRFIYFFGATGVSYKSKNCGRTYQRFTHADDLYDFKLNKMDPSWIMAFRDKPCAKNDVNCKDYYKKSIYISENAGDTWKSALNYVRDASWDKLLQYQLIPDQRIIVCHMRDGKSVVSYSDDYFETVEVMQHDAMGFFQTNHYIFVLTKEKNQDEGYALQIAPAYLDKFQPQEVKLPVSLSQHSFTILDTSEGQIFISVSHKEENQRLTNVYVSDFRGFKFTLSLLHNVRSLDSGNCDFERILGMEGVYVANVYDHQEVEKVRGRTQTNVQTLELYKKTYISYDKGGNWHPLKAPTVDANNEETKCSGDCSLHLKGRTESNQNPLYSSQNSPGLAMGVGNTGLYLSQKNSELSTYLTRDGGHEWYEIRKGSHMYEIGDRGGLIVMAQDDKPVNKVIYSWDEGLTWEEIEFKQNRTFEVQNIVTEPSNMEQKFLVYGSSTEDGKLKGYVVALNFQTLHTRVCSGSWDPTMPESDYEFWIPKNFDNKKCLFGRKMKYIRRKRDAKCFNQEEVDKRFFVETCPCIEDDWECDYGFYRKIEGGPCVPLADNFEEDEVPDLLKPPKDCKNTYMKTRGYRKVSGDYCQGGVDLSPIQTPCPVVEQPDEINNQTQTISDKPKPKLQIAKPQQQVVENNQSLLWKFVIILSIFIGLLLFKDKILERFQRKKNSPQNQLHKNYERLRLFNEEDDDEAGL